MTAPIAYLDNNATTAMCKDAIAAMNSWVDVPANPSSSSKYGIAARKMINDARKYILTHCHAPNYLVIFTSGASESNSFILRATVAAYHKSRGVTPHILTSLTEHKSIILCCESLKTSGAAEVTYLAPGASGCIPVALIKAGIRPNTCIISIMAANNELGCINNLTEIGKIAHEHAIPFHSDCVQTFGKFRINLPKENIDAISASFHKLTGPKGCGLLVINKDLVDGYGLESQISGTQEGGLRGGTENVAAIAGAIAAMKHTFEDRAKKNAKLFAQRDYVVSKLSNRFPVADYRSFLAQGKNTKSADDNAEADASGAMGDDARAKPAKSAKSGKSGSKNAVSLVFLGPECKTKNARDAPLPKVLPNTILLSVVKDDESAPFCNVKLKNALDKSGVVVSIGSACNTASPDASHVLDAIHAPDVIKRGVIRISFCDTTTKKELDAFIGAFTAAVNAQIKK